MPVVNFLMSQSASQGATPCEVNIITMGCSKNLVDSEQLAAQLEANHYLVLHESRQPMPITIINTCGFIADAKEQSVNMIFDCIAQKNAGKIKTLIVFGCLSGRYMSELRESIPEVDAFFGTDALQGILAFLGATYYADKLVYRKTSTPEHYAYLKISEGCSHQCAFCAIPKIRGPQISKPISVVKREAEILAQRGVKELLLVAQDLSFYGKDINNKYMLAQLVEELAQIPGIEWIRMHYTYPNSFQYELLDLMLQYPNVCRYIDMPMQHINNTMLQAMHRHISGEDIIRMLETIKNKVPDVALRTSLIVGFPGETKAMYKELENFVARGYFDRLGVFTYSHEENTPSYVLKDNVTQAEKQRRQEGIMAIQHDISLTKNQSMVGQTFKVVIDSKQGKYYEGRTQYDSPEVDNTVLLPTRNHHLQQGGFYDVKITRADAFDLTGEVMDN